MNICSHRCNRISVTIDAVGENKSESEKAPTYSLVVNEGPSESDGAENARPEATIFAGNDVRDRPEGKEKKVRPDRISTTFESFLLGDNWEPWTPLYEFHSPVGTSWNYSRPFLLR